MQIANTTIINKLGLHARAAALLASTAGRYASTLKITAKSKQVDAKSVMSLMLLGASQGTEVELYAEGQDEQEAIKALIDLIAQRFNEPE